MTMRYRYLRWNYHIVALLFVKSHLKTSIESAVVLIRARVRVNQANRCVLVLNLKGINIWVKPISCNR